MGYTFCLYWKFWILYHLLGHSVSYFVFSTVVTPDPDGEGTNQTVAETIQGRHQH